MTTASNQTSACVHTGLMDAEVKGEVKGTVPEMPRPGNARKCRPGNAKIHSFRASAAHMLSPYLPSLSWIGLYASVI